MLARILATDSHTLALSYGVVHQTLCSPITSPSGFLIGPGFFFKYWDRKSEKRRSPMKQIRAVLFRCCLEVILGRQFTNFRFFELPNGKQAVINRIMTHLMEK